MEHLDRPLLCTYRLTDLEQFAELIHHDGATLTKIAPGKVPDTIELLHLPQVLVRRGRQNASWACEAGIHAGKYAFLIPWNMQGNILYNGVRMDGSMISMYGPGAEYFSMCAACDYLWISVPVALFDQEMQNLRGWTPRCAGRSFFPRSGTSAVRMVVFLVEHMARAVGKDAMLSEAALLTMQHTLIAHLAMALEPPPDAAGHTSQRVPSHESIFRQALTYMRAHMHGSIYLSDICRACHVSERLLRQVFQEFSNHSPIIVLNSLRFQRAHRLLLMGSPATMTVKYAALDSGFWDLGRFSVCYKALFHESPSITLSREPAPGLMDTMHFRNAR